MKLVVISSSEKFKSEIPFVLQLFENGLENFHLKKSKFTRSRMEEYIEAIPEKYHSRIIIHSFHDLIRKYNLKGIHLTKRHKKKGWKTTFRLFWLKLVTKKFIVTTSCHDLFKLTEYSRKYEYVFLSPVFDSISKSGHGAGFSFGTVKKVLSETNNNVLALGGIKESKINEVKSLGFNGAVLLGVLWNNNGNPVQTFKNIKQLLDNDSSINEIKINPVKIEM